MNGKQKYIGYVLADISEIEKQNGRDHKKWKGMVENRKVWHKTRLEKNRKAKLRDAMWWIGNGLGSEELRIDAMRK